MLSIGVFLPETPFHDSSRMSAYCTVRWNTTADYLTSLYLYIHPYNAHKDKKDRRLVHPRAAKQGRTDCHLPWPSLAGNTAEEREGTHPSMIRIVKNRWKGTQRVKKERVDMPSSSLRLSPSSSLTGNATCTRLKRLVACSTQIRAVEACRFPVRGVLRHVDDARREGLPRITQTQRYRAQGEK